MGLIFIVFRGIGRYSSSNIYSNNNYIALRDGFKRSYSNSMSKIDKGNLIEYYQSQGLIGGTIVYNGNIYNPRLNQVVTENIDRLLTKLSKKGNGQAFCLLPIASMAGMGGLYIRNLSALHHYIPGLNANESINYSKVVTELLFKANLKYDVSDKVKLLIKYYPSGMSKKVSRLSNKDLKNKIYNKYKEFKEEEDLLINLHKKYTQNGKSRELGPFEALPKGRTEQEELRNIIVMDLETFVDDDGSQNVYAAGYKTDQGSMKTYYVTNYKDEKDMLQKFLDDIISIASPKTTVYAHNWAKFDGVIMLEYILDWTVKNKAVMEPIITSMDIKSITVSTKGNQKKVIKFQDSFLMLMAGLGKLTLFSKTSATKGNFPHSFVTKDNLNYSGGKPDIKHYDNISEAEYRKITNTWDLKSQCLSYLEKDLTCLLEVIEVFRTSINEKYGLDIAKISTMPSLALKVFRKCYYNVEEDVRIITHKVYNIIKKAFIGGRAEVYIPFGKDLYLYDINSLYPYAMTKPMPVGVPRYIGFENPTDIDSIKNEMGFAIVEAKVPRNTKRPLLPVKVKGLNYCPTGKWTGIYFIPELKDLAMRGYTFKVYGYFKFNKSRNLFKEYVKDQYLLKANASNEVSRFTHKLMLNALFGRFGMLDYHYITKIVSIKMFNYIIDRYYVDNYVLLKNTQSVLVSYDTSKSLEIKEKELLNKEQSGMKLKNFNIKVKPNIQSIPIAAAITSYARIEMNKVLGNKDIKVYYTDTDSVVVNKPLPKNMVSKKVLGKFKLEEEIKKAYFILPKVYKLELKDGSYKPKFKGIKNMKDLGIYEEVVRGNKDMFINKGEQRMYKDLWGLKGLKEHKITQKFNMNLITRKKVINKNNKWINTKPYNYRSLLKEKNK